MWKSGLLVGIMLLMSFEARADFFKYKDSSGAIVITDKLENVPKEYRKQLKVIWDEDLEAKDPLKRRWAAASELREKKEQEQKQRKEAEKKKSSDGKRVVITVDEETGQLKRTLE
ncbi:MAG: hypothetical protein JJE30_03615 [Desulfuromonadales bacterium]|nr:hypothetical protein [Desulfuromonadales bacterium]